MVTLSGGDLGGEKVPGNGWAVGEEHTIDGLIYRREPDDLAVYVGAA
jgi:hypothetical protein